ncbi:MAG: hypothetical protein ACOC7N_06335, partial [Chloroflexota bacterium]
FNSWGEADFWAKEVVTETDQGVHASYGPQDVLGQLPPDGAYVVLNHTGGGPIRLAERYGPEYERQDLGALWTQTDCREGNTHPGATVVPFFKWGRYLRLEVYCASEVPEATAEEVNALLDSWRFDEVPAGDVGWASVEARNGLPASVQPQRFPLLTAGVGQSTSQRENIVRTTSAAYPETRTTPGTQIPGATVVVTFTYRWDAPLGGPLPSECPPDRCHWWRFEAGPDGDIVLMEEGGAEDWESASLLPTPTRWFPLTATPAATPSPATGREGAFAAAQAALADYQPVEDAGAVVEALSQDCAAWLSAGHDPAGLADALQTLPKLTTSEVEVATVDLNGDGLRDVVVEPQFFGLPVLMCLAQGGEGYGCQPVPDLATLGGNKPIMQSGVLSQDLIGDGRPETAITYTVSGGSRWTELLTVFNWPETTSPDLIFHAELVNWAGWSTWQFEPDPTSPGRQQIVLTYPHLYTHGFDHKMLNHPVGRQVWRWDSEAERFVLADRAVDMSQSGWGPEMEITTEDRLRWLTNEGETSFRTDRHQEALSAYEEALALAAAEEWAPEEGEPDWVGLLRFRRAETLAHLGQVSDAVRAMEDVASDYEDDLLGELAAAFLAGYGDGSGPDATEEACAALRQLEKRVGDHFYHEREGALRFPMTAAGILICEPDPGAVAPDETAWPRVGAFEAHVD